MDFTQEINHYAATLKRTIDALSRTEINTVYDLLLKAYEEERQIFIMGNGGSAATASHMVCDFNKGMCFDKPKRFKMICLNDNVPSLMALANDIGYDVVFVEQLKNFMQPGDYVIGISGSGNSENVIQAIQYANENEGVTIGFCGYSGGKLKQQAQYSIHVNINDMQIVEDVHMMLDHMTMRVLGNYLHSQDKPAEAAA